MVYKWIISGIFPANWVIIYDRSHPLQEPKKSIEKRLVLTPDLFVATEKEQWEKK